MYLLATFHILTDTYYKLPMKNLQKENQPNKLNQPIHKHKKNTQLNRPIQKEHNDYYDKISILKESALLALAEKNEVIEVLTNSLNHQQQLTCSLNDEKAEDRAFFDLLLAKINQKNEEVDCARQQIKKKEMQVEQLKESIEYGQWQKQQLLQQLQKYQLENQDLRQIISELVTENHKLKELLRLPHPNPTSDQHNHSTLNSLAESAAQEYNIQNDRNEQNLHQNDRNEQNLHLRSAEHSEIETQLRQNRSPALNVLLLQRTGSIGEFTNLCQENDLIDFNEHSVSQGMKESLVKKHCLAMSLKAIKHIDTYSLNSTSKKITDYESQLTARYFHYVNEKDIDRGCEGNSVGDLQMQNYEDIIEQPEQAEQEIQQPTAKSDGWDVLSKLTWTGLGMLLGSTLTLLFKR